MEDYFNQPLDDLRKDEHSVLGHYVGFTARAVSGTTGQGCPGLGASAEGQGTSTGQGTSKSFGISTQPLAPRLNNKFFWHMGKNLKAPYETQLPALLVLAALNSSNVVPSPDFLRKRWAGIMDQWGKSMRNAYVLNS